MKSIKAVTVFLSAVLLLNGCGKQSENKEISVSSYVETEIFTTEPVTESPTESPTKSNTEPPVEYENIEFIHEENEITADDGTVLFKSHVDYPQISTGNTQVDDKINQYYREIKDICLTTAEELEADKKIFQEIYDNCIQNGEIWYPFESYMEISVKYYSEDYVSFYNLEYTYANGAQRSPSDYSKNYSLKTGEELTFDDIFTDDFKPFAEEYIINELKKREEEYGLWDNYAERTKVRIENESNWYLTENGFLITFIPYEITAFAKDIIEVEIPYEDMQKYIKNAPL
jgi:hypothetical protein